MQLLVHKLIEVEMEGKRRTETEVNKMKETFLALWRW